MFVLQTWAPRPPSWLKWTATACVFFVLFLPQGTSSFIFRGCVTMGRTFQGRVTSNGILKLSPLTLLPLAGFWSIIHQVQGNEPDIETPSSFFLFVCLIDRLVGSFLFFVCLFCFVAVIFSLFSAPSSPNYFSQTVYYTVHLFLICVHNISHCRMLWDL